jgi:hypothetical protein
MTFKYSVEEHKKDNHKFVTITGTEEKAKDLIIPDMIDNIPVEAIGNHAFSGRDDIYSVTLPGSIRTIYGFAFHNCRNLKKITLSDSIDDYYDGVIRQCDSLTDIEITIKRGWYEVIRNFLADNDKTLRFLIKRDNSMSCLTFPEYVYDFAENTMARTIQFSIGGSGMIYRECVDRRLINYREYDKLFEKAVIDGNAISEDIAIGRVLFPYELEEGFKSRYEAFIEHNGNSIITRLIEQIESSQKGDLASVSGELDTMNIVKELISYRTDNNSKILTDECLDLAIKLASDKKLTLLSALLIDNAGASTSSDVNAFVF